ncbi:hypothetical protein ACJYHJ_004204 [Pseudomonas aeruginosa]
MFVQALALLQGHLMVTKSLNTASSGTEFIVQLLERSAGVKVEGGLRQTLISILQDLPEGANVRDLQNAVLGIETEQVKPLLDALDQMANAPLRSQDEYWQLFKAGELIQLDAGEPRVLNLASSFHSDADSILGVFEAASGTKLSDSQLRAAKTAGLELAAGGEPTVRSLVERWALVEGLEDFAAAVKAAMMPV